MKWNTNFLKAQEYVVNNLLKFTVVYGKSGCLLHPLIANYSVIVNDSVRAWYTIFKIWGVKYLSISNHDNIQKW